MPFPRWLLICVSVLLFLVVSFGVARWLTRETRERSAVLAVLRAQVDGDAARMVELMPGCAQDAACRDLARSDARKLRRAGDVKILTYETATRYALGSARGNVRVAWDIGTLGNTVVQCVTTARHGFAGFNGAVSVERISAPIGREASCPG